MDYIGLSAATLLLGNGDILGCSGIVSSIFVKPGKNIGTSEWVWKVIFVAAFMISSQILAQFEPSDQSLTMERQHVAQSRTLPFVSTLGFCVAGFAVGFGTRLGNGCNSGHG